MEGVETVVQVLQAAGYERLPKPLVVGGSTFDFDAAARGTGVSHDLVVVATSPASPGHLVRLLVGLSRMLDQTQSLRPVSLVLLGDEVDGSTMVALERSARVLIVPGPSVDAEAVARAVSVLLPLALPANASHGRDPLSEVAALLGASLTEEHQSLIDAAKVGHQAVQEALRRYVDDAVQGPTADGGDL